MDSCINLYNQGMFYIYEPFQDHGAKIIRWWSEKSFKWFWAPVFRRNQSLAAVRMNALFQCHFQNLSGYLNYEKVLQHNPRIDCTKHRVFRKNEKEGTNIDFFGENMMNKHEIFAKKNQHRRSRKTRLASHTTQGSGGKWASLHEEFIEIKCSTNVNVK